MYKYVLNLVVKISLMFAQYFEHYTIILRGPFFRGHAVMLLIELCVVITVVYTILFKNAFWSQKCIKMFISMELHQQSTWPITVHLSPKLN